MTPTSTLLNELRNHLASSNAEARKYWAQQIIEGEIPLEEFLCLFSADLKTAQRFMWLVGDLADQEPDILKPVLPFLFSLRGEMPFPGMPRSVAKWLGCTGVPTEIEAQAVPQMLAWINDSKTSIACKSYSAKTLYELVADGRLDSNQLANVLRAETQFPNKAYAARMQKLLSHLEQA